MNYYETYVVKNAREQTDNLREALAEDCLQDFLLEVTITSENRSEFCERHTVEFTLTVGVPTVSVVVDLIPFAWFCHSWERSIHRLHMSVDDGRIWLDLAKQYKEHCQPRPMKHHPVTIRYPRIQRNKKEEKRNRKEEKIPATTVAFRLDILHHLVRQQGGDYWEWFLTSANGDFCKSGRVDELPGEYDLDGEDWTAEAEWLCAELCCQFDLDRSDVVLSNGWQSLVTELNYGN